MIGYGLHRSIVVLEESQPRSKPAAQAAVSARHSLRWRLPILIACLIAFILATFLYAAYRSVKATLVQTASERAQSAADQVASMLDGQRSIDQSRQLGRDADFRRFLKTRTDDAREAARARMKAIAGMSLRRVERWDAAGSRLLEVSVPEAAGAGKTPRELPPGSAPSAAGIGPLQESDGIVFNGVITEIRDEDLVAGQASGLLGYLRVRSTFRESPPGIFGRLVGHSAVVKVGNRSGGVWTDLSRVVPPPPVDVGRPGVGQYRAPDGEMRLGAVAPVNLTPWAVWVEFRLPTIIAPARLFLNAMAGVGLIFVAVAAVLATALASRITRPLAEVSTAAAALAQGDYSRRVGAERADEIGQLGRTFNAMAADIQSTADALRRSEDSYHQLFASNPHPMWVFDVETLRFLDVNEMAIAKYGYSRDEFLAMTIKDIRPAGDVPALLETVAAFKGGPELSGIWRHQKKDGSVIAVDVSSQELVLEGRRARAVLAHDITERLQAKQALLEREALFRGMAETMPHVVWTARPDGGFEYYNHRWFDYTGLRSEDSQGLGWQSALHPDDRQAALSGWSQAVQSGATYEVSYRIQRAADGAYRWHIGRAAPLRNEAGEIVMWVGTMTDVDDRIRHREALKTLNAELEQRVATRTSELEAANRELESFSYSVSHDLRAPLRHVQAYVEMLVAETDGQLSEKGRHYARTIGDATVEMGELIDDLLAFSRIARVQMSEGRVSLDSLVQNTIRGLEIATRDRHIIWNIGSLPAVVGDPSMLKQVYANLIGNAVKYTRHREPSEIEIGCAGEHDGQRVLFVRDNGAGFDMRYVDKLFGVFQRLHRSDEFEGTGIGLALVRRIILRHGGRTWAEGKVNEGATIYFTLKEAAPDHHASEER